MSEIDKLMALKFHPSASHIRPDYRDGWNAAIDAAAALKPEDALDTQRLDWLLKKRMLFAWSEINNNGKYSCIKAQGRHNVVGIESSDPRAVIDAAMKEPNA
jgi:hypothetical protein